MIPWIFADLDTIIDCYSDIKQGDAMRDPKRITKTLQEIQKVWEQFPDLRLGQLLLNATDDTILYYLEDEELVEYLKKFYERFKYESKN